MNGETTMNEVLQKAAGMVLDQSLDRVTIDAELETGLKVTWELRLVAIDGKHLELKGEA